MKVTYYLMNQLSTFSSRSSLHHIDEVAVVEVVVVELSSMVHKYRENKPEAEEKVLSKMIIVLPLPEGNSLNKKPDAKD